MDIVLNKLITSEKPHNILNNSHVPQPTSTEIYHRVSNEIYNRIPNEMYRRVPNEMYRHISGEMNYHIPNEIIQTRLKLPLDVIESDNCDEEEEEDNCEDDDDCEDNDDIISNIDPFNMIQSSMEITKTPRNIWTYWENINCREIPTHIQLCLETMKYHLAKKYNLYILDEKSILKYLNITANIKNELDKLLIAQKVDYYRVALLYKYGGIWIDADSIIMKDFDDIFDKLDNEFDFVGFGCTGEKCTNGYQYPSNWAMGSRKYGILMNHTLKNLNNELKISNKHYEYFDLGKKIIWKNLHKLQKEGYDYYHYPSLYDGTRDINGNWVHSPNHFSTNFTELIDINSVFFVILANYEISNQSEYSWVKTCDRDKLLYGPYWISMLYRKALNIQ